MRKIIIGLAFGLAFMSCQNEKVVRLKGKIENGENGKIFFENTDVYFSKRLDSTILRKSGNFSFKTKIKNTGFYELRFDSAQAIPLLLKPGEKVNITGDFKKLQNVKIKGSEGSQLLSELQYNLMLTQAKIDSVSELYNKSESFDKENLLKKYNEILENHRKYSIGFILKNLGSMASYSALYQQYKGGYPVFNKVKDIQYYKLVTDSLSKKYSKSQHVIALKENTASMLNNYNSKRIMSMVTEEDYHLPEIKLPSINNDSIRLSSLKGKIVLLSFWSTWAEKSAEYNVKLKELYKKYKNKGFEIYSVSVDNSRESWINAIKFDELNWINVVDTLYPNSISLVNYNIQALPSNYLIGKDFESILARDLTPAQLDTKLKQLLK